jgi:hypothetical protein
MNVTVVRGSSLLILAALVLSGCQVEPKKVVYTPAPVVEAPPPVPAPDAEQVRRQRMLADQLYSAKRAYDDNRLMTPVGNSAYDLYTEVLRLDPGNAVALAGLDEIALRYIALADEASNKGQYDQAGGLLDRSARLGSQRPELLDARERLAAARRNRMEMHVLDPAQLSAQSVELMNELAIIAQDIQRRDATFVINARTDPEGRWIYKVMREAVGGARLHGNIGISGTPGILISATVAPTGAEQEVATVPVELSPAERAAQQSAPRVLEQHPARAARPAVQ